MKATISSLDRVPTSCEAGAIGAEDMVDNSVDVEVTEWAPWFKISSDTGRIVRDIPVSGSVGQNMYIL